MTREELARECLRIEKEGGDVLGYIEVNMPSYTPRAAWYNLQKQFTGRRGSMLTDGRPKDKPGKENRELGKSKQKLSEVIETLLEGVRAGNDPWKVLTAMGYTNPIAAMKNAKVWCRVNAPELMPELERIVLHDPSKKPRRSSKEAPDSEPVENPTDEQSAAETVEFGGKTYEKAEKAEQKAPKAEQNTGDHISAEEYRKISGEIEKPKKKPATCCAPSTRKGVEVPDVLPVCAVKSRVHGVWELSAIEGCVSLTWENRITHQECFLGMTAAEWRKLANEIPVMLKQLGLD